MSGLSGCLGEAGMEKLRRGKAPTIAKGAYADDIATADHILPRSIVPELDNRLYNLEFMPETKNQIKSNKVGERELALAREWHGLGLLSDEGLRAIESREAKQ